MRDVLCFCSQFNSQVGLAGVVLGADVCGPDGAAVGGRQRVLTRADGFCCDTEQQLLSHFIFLCVGVCGGMISPI